MAGSVKGLIVEIGGDTSGLQKALSKVNSATSSLSKELKQVNSLLKLDPKNTELLKQKQDVLNQSMQETRNKLTQLQSIKEESDKKMAEGTKINEENYRALQREIIKTQDQLGKLELETDSFYRAGKKVEEFGNKVTDIGKKINDLGTKLSTRLTLPIAGIATAGVAYNAQIEKMTTAYTTFLGDAKEAEKVVNDIIEKASRTPFDATSLIEANQMLISTGINADEAQEVILSLGDAITATGGGNAELSRMAANLQQIKNAGQATALDIKQFAYAGIDIYGLLADYTGKTTAEVKEMKVSYEVLTEALKKAGKEGGKYYGAMDKASGTLTGQVNKLKAQVKNMTGELTKSLMPVAKDIISKVQDLIKKFNGLSDAQKTNIVNIGLMVAAAGPLLKILGTVGTTVGTVAKGVGTFTQAIGVMVTGTKSSSDAVNRLASVMSFLKSPVGIATTAIGVGLVAAISNLIKKEKEAEEETKKAFSGMVNSVGDWHNGVKSAESYLDTFNSTLFATAEEQEKLNQNMQEVQNGITSICRRASEERRDYTDEEITQLNEYFQKLREIKNREIEIQQQIATAITQQAKTNAETFNGSLAEYQVQSQKWIKTAEEQSNRTIDLIEEGTTQEIALLNQRFGDEANMQNEAYANEYNAIMQQKQEKIDAARSEVSEISSIYAKHYTDLSQNENDFLNNLKETDRKLKEEKEKTHQKLEEINLFYSGNEQILNKKRNEALLEFIGNEGKIWNEYIENMDETESKYLESWLEMQLETEIKGGEISDETRELVNRLIDSYALLPEETRNTMKNAMQPMLDEMKKSEPELYAKASGIAGGILNRLKKAFDINSPSRKTRSIFQNVMKRCRIRIRR